VDQVPQVLNRVMPHIPPSLTSEIKTPAGEPCFSSSTPRGEVQNIRIIGSCGSPQVDEIVRKVIFEWSFAPAVRKGVKGALSLLQQAMILKISGGPALNFKNMKHPCRLLPSCCSCPSPGGEEWMTC